MLFAVTIALVLMGAFVFLSSNVKSTAAEKFSGLFLETAYSSIESATAELVINYRESAGNTTKTLSIPAKIGEQSYYVYGYGKTIMLKTRGSPSVSLQKDFNLANITFEGSAFSTNEKIFLMYLPQENKVVLK